MIEASSSLPFLDPPETFSLRTTVHPQDTCSHAAEGGTYRSYAAVEEGSRLPLDFIDDRTRPAFSNCLVTDHG